MTSTVKGGERALAGEQETSGPAHPGSWANDNRLSFPVEHRAMAVSRSATGGRA